MVCINCNQEIEDNIKFCPHCGCTINVQTVKSYRDRSSSILLWFLIIYVAISLLGNIITGLLLGFNTGLSGKMISGLPLIISSLLFLLIPLAIKRKKIRIIAFVIVAIMVLFRVFSYIMYCYYVPTN